MDRGRRGKGVVRAGEIPPVLPPAAERMAGGRASVADLCGPRLLNNNTGLVPRMLRSVEGCAFRGPQRCAADPGPILPCGDDVGPGSAAQREERCTASGTRRNI